MAATTSSSIKPTGWIRSNSKPSPPVLGDRTNLPSGSRHTPLRTLSKLSNGGTASTAAQSASKVGSSSIQVGAGKQRKLSSFFAPNTAPAAASTTSAVAAEKLRARGDLDSPSVRKVQRTNGNGVAATVGVAALEDEDLEARAANLLRGRFGSVSRSLTASRSSTPTRAPSPPPPMLPRSNPEPLPQRADPLAARPLPRLQQQQPQQHTTPPRPRPPQQEQETSPQWQPTMMQETLSNFTLPLGQKAQIESLRCSKGWQDCQRIRSKMGRRRGCKMRWERRIGG